MSNIEFTSLLSAPATTTEAADYISIAKFPTAQRVLTGLEAEEDFELSTALSIAISDALAEIGY
jgi:hypothetical protein